MSDDIASQKLSENRMSLPLGVWMTQSTLLLNGGGRELLDRSTDVITWAAEVS